MAYNEHEKDLEALEHLPLIKNTRRPTPNVHNQPMYKAHELSIKTLEKRVKTLETKLETAILEVERLTRKQNKASKLLTQRDIDGYHSKQENIPR